MDFFMSIEYSEVLVQNGFAPLRPDVAPPKGMQPLSDVKLIRPPAAELKTEIPKIIEKFRAHVRRVAGPRWLVMFSKPNRA